MTAEPGRREPRNVPSLLSRLRQERFSGAVEVEGGSGGTLFLDDGLVCAVESPSAPSARSVLLRSGRIDERDWEATLVAVAEGAEGGVPAAVLTARGLITAAELFVVCTAALFDGAFAMALQPVTGWRVHPGRVPELAARPGQEPARLTEETALRLRTLREQVPSVGEFARTPVRPGARADLGRLGARGRTLLLGANGRRTPRDLAFALGRGVYPVMLDLARLSARGYLAREAGPAAPRPLLSARTADRAATPPPGAGDRPLPRRRPGTNLPPDRPFGSPLPGPEDQRDAVDGLRLIRTALLGSSREGARAPGPEAPGAAPAGAAPPTAEPPVAESPAPVAASGTASGTGTGRPEESAP